MENLLNTPLKKIIFYVLVFLVVIAIGYLIFFRKTETQPIMSPELKPISSTNDTDGIKNGKYREVSNSKFFGSNPNNWNITIKFNLETFNKTLQCIIGNVQDNSAINWGLWITPQRKLQWKIGNSTWDLNNFGELKDNTLYEISITYNGSYNFSLKDLSSNKQIENFNIIDDPIVINAPSLNTSSGTITFGGDFLQSNMNSKFLGSINEIKSSEIVQVSTMLPTTMLPTTMGTTTMGTPTTTIAKTTTIAPITTTIMPTTTPKPTLAPKVFKNLLFRKTNLNIPISIDFPSLNNLSDWEINIHFRQTGTNSPYALGLLGNYNNNEVSRDEAWGVWVGQNNTGIKWINKGTNLTLLTNLTVSLNVDYILRLSWNGSSITFNLINLDTLTSKIETLANQSPLLINRISAGGWPGTGAPGVASFSMENFIGTISEINVDTSRLPVTTPPPTTLYEPFAQFLRLGQQLQISTPRISGYIGGSVVKISGDGTKLLVGGYSQGSKGGVRVYKLVNNNWTQEGGDIYGNDNGFAGTPEYKSFENCISMSNDGTIFTTVETGLGDPNYKRQVNIFKYDANKSAAQNNSALPNFGPENWSRTATIPLTGSKTYAAAAVISADGKTIAVSDVTLRIYFSNDGGTTWTQRGTTINEPRNATKSDNGGFSVKLSISSNGNTVLIAGAPMYANGDKVSFMSYDWDGTKWNESFIEDLWWGDFDCKISADGTICVLNWGGIKRYSRVGTGEWKKNSQQSLPADFNISISNDASYLGVSYIKGYEDIGSADMYIWNGTMYVKIVNKVKTNAKQPGTPGGMFNISLSGDGLRFAVGSPTEIDVYSLSDRLRSSITSFDKNLNTNCVLWKSPDFDIGKFASYDDCLIEAVSKPYFNEIQSITWMGGDNPKCWGLKIKGNKDGKGVSGVGDNDVCGQKR